MSFDFILDFILQFVPECIFGLILIYYPYPEPIKQIFDDFEILQVKYQKWETFAIIPLFTFITLMAFLFQQLLAFIHELTVSKDVTAVFQLALDEGVWFVPGGIFAFAFIGYPMERLYRYLLKEKYDEYIHFTNVKHGYDGYRVYQLMARGLGILGIGLLFLISDCSFSVYKDKIVWDEFRSLSSKTYMFSQIQAIHFIPSPTPDYKILFSDGNCWDSGSNLYKSTKNESMIVYLAQQSHIQVDTVTGNTSGNQPE